MLQNVINIMTSYTNSYSFMLACVGKTKITDLSQVTDTLYHIMLYTSPWSRFELTTSVVIGTDSIGSCKHNYHTISTKTVPKQIWLDYECVINESVKAFIYDYLMLGHSKVKGLLSLSVTCDRSVGFSGSSGFHFRTLLHVFTVES
jgi:hypothetical protein